MFKFLNTVIVRVLGRWALTAEKQSQIKSHWGNIDNCGVSKLH
jgi:hypothetical protein